MEYKHYLKNYFKILVDDILKYSTLAIAEKRWMLKINHSVTDMWLQTK